MEAGEALKGPPEKSGLWARRGLRAAAPKPQARLLLQQRQRQAEEQRAQRQRHLEFRGIRGSLGIQPKPAKRWKVLRQDLNQRV